MKPSMRLLYSFSLFAPAILALGHSSSSHLPPGEDWATYHMAEEHHINNFDPATFFILHDYDYSGTWTEDEIRRTYGLDDESSFDVPQHEKDEVVREILKLMDTDHDGKISREEFTKFREGGGKMPDFGHGSGHHHDDEYEYEIHHFEKFHGDDAREEDLTHPEDIAHFKKHDHDADAEQHQMKLDRMSIVEANIPVKFRRQL